MANFISFQNILPDPNNKISRSGGSVNSVGNLDLSSKLGPGFASVKFSTKQPIMMSRTNSGRVITRSIAAHSWNISISYNPLTREEFEPVFAFLLSYGRLNPFFVSLPQYLESRDTQFAAANPAKQLTTAEGASIAAGRTYMQCSWTGTDSEYPKVGDMFTITDPGNSNSFKAYMVTRFESVQDANTSFDAATQPSSSAASPVRIHFNPPLVTAVSNGSTLDFTAPKIRVIKQGDVTGYDLGVDGLYKFNLQLEEALP
tara:strand:+ start:608 stop:1381 length:774 start_codon:yes stop_codon:yes gene_type:complete